MKKTLKLLILIMLISTFVLSVMMTNVNAEATEGNEGGEGIENVEETEGVEGTETEEFYLEDETKTVKLNSTAYLWYKNKPVGESIVWTSADEDIATVSEDGKVIAVGIGTTTITAEVAGTSDTCEIIVEYDSLTISSNESNYATSINLVLEEHPTETLKVKVEDGKYQEVLNAEVTWKSSDVKVATVDSKGKVTAIGVGTTTITAEAAGVSYTCEVNVVAAPKFTDFSKAKYELLFDMNTDLKISGITPKGDNGNNYYYIITDTNQKPTLAIEKSGRLDLEANNVEYLNVNVDENYIYNTTIDKYIELKQDLYLWVIQQVKLDKSYHNGENTIYDSTKFVVEGEKLTRPELPQLNLILKGFNISGNWHSENTEQDSSTWIRFKFPSATENRKFSIKIGRITDNAILKKIQNNDYSGITELQAYAKKDKGVFSTNLTTTYENYYYSEQALCDGNAIFVDDAYYYIYVKFDDENGKYIPIEGVTLGQANLSSTTDFWELWAYTREDFEWNNLESKYEEKEETPKDETVADKEIPKAGASKVIAIAVMILGVSFVISYKKYNKYKGI